MEGREGAKAPNSGGMPANDSMQINLKVDHKDLMHGSTRPLIVACYPKWTTNTYRRQFTVHWPYRVTKLRAVLDVYMALSTGGGAGIKRHFARGTPSASRLNASAARALPLYANWGAKARECAACSRINFADRPTAAWLSILLCLISVIVQWWLRSRINIRSKLKMRSSRFMSDCLDQIRLERKRSLKFCTCERFEI